MSPRDGDSYGDACEPDNDGVSDDDDNCALVANASQADSDLDNQGDACDVDDDGDNVNDSIDTCVGTPAGVPVVWTTGCSLEQSCPSMGAWKNHGSFLGCVSGTASTLTGQGSITAAQKGALTAAAARTDIGKKK